MPGEEEVGFDLSEGEVRTVPEDDVEVGSAGQPEVGPEGVFEREAGEIDGSQVEGGGRGAPGPARLGRYPRRR